MEGIKVPTGHVKNFIIALKGCIQRPDMEVSELVEVAKKELEAYRQKRIQTFIESYFRLQGMQAVDAFVRTLDVFLEEQRAEKSKSVLSGITNPLKPAKKDRKPLNVEAIDGEEANA